MNNNILINANLAKNKQLISTIKNNKFLVSKNSQIITYSEKDWYAKFSKFTNDKFDTLVIFTKSFQLPFLYFSKQLNNCVAIPFNKDLAILAKQHNNANVIIIDLSIVQLAQVNILLNAFFKANFAGGRHQTRLDIMHKSFLPGKKVYKFANNSKQTCVIASDHAGYELKKQIINYLETKKIQVLDTGTYSLVSTHYPAYAIALGLNVSRANFGIAVCSTGVGISNTVNKFKGLKACLCLNAKQVEYAAKTLGMNVLGLGNQFKNFKDVKKAINAFIAAKPRTSKQYAKLNNLGFNFSIKEFKKIKIDKAVPLPKILKK